MIPGRGAPAGRRGGPREAWVLPQCGEGRPQGGGGGGRAQGVGPPPQHGSSRLRRADRLRSRRDFRRVERSGRRRSSRHFVAVLAPGWDPERTRLGLAVGRRVAGAVGRNRLKRRLRSWFRLHRAALPVGRDLVIVARRGSAELDAGQIEAELEELVR